MHRPPTNSRERLAPLTDCGRCPRLKLCWPLMPAVSSRVTVTQEPLCAPGRSLWSQGATFRGLFVITGGCLKLVERSSDGTEAVIGFRFPGDLVGLDALADGRHTDEAIALEELATCRLQWDPKAESDGFSVLDRELLKRQALELRRLRAQRRLAGRSALSAVAGCLSQLSGALEPDASGRIRLPMSGAELASYLGVAEATVSRTLGALERAGRIARNGRRLWWIAGRREDNQSTTGGSNPSMLTPARPSC